MRLLVLCAAVLLVAAAACEAQIPPAFQAADPSQQLKTTGMAYDGPHRWKAFSTAPVVRKGPLVTVQGPAFEDLEKDTKEAAIREVEKPRKPVKRTRPRKRARR